MILKNSNGDTCISDVMISGFVEITEDDLVAILNSRRPSQSQLSAEGKFRALDEARKLRVDILARLNGLHIDALYNNDVPPVIAAIMVAKQALKDITVHPTVLAATDYDTTKVAILTRYYEIAATLGVAAPTAVSAFVGLDQ